ncbi:MAG: HD domain-containing protein [Bacteroidia bacterium]|nr:HD domain-containing protein [Bacteroidia bacterium]MCZ2277791.1 HD domain-containing protein [Bacteroidia bacterium]
MTGYKIFNDPLYGFITVPRGILLDLIDHPYMQRLHRIRQLGLSYLVYPGALHTRFHHALGALHLVQQAIEVLRSKGARISEAEATGVQIAVLLHDIGHSPYSHLLENVIVKDKGHEELTLLFMKELNREFKGELNTAIRIFQNRHPKKFLHNLISGQLDMDRLDYLNRDSFFTGVAEGVVSNDRIIKMLNVHRDQLVVEEKGIYSIEKFLIARRLMYWQVYLHKTVLSAEKLLVNITMLARKMAHEGNLAFIPVSLQPFFFSDKPLGDKDIVSKFSLIDDADVSYSVKHWMMTETGALQQLSGMLINRKLYKIRLSNKPFATNEIIQAEKSTRSAAGSSLPNLRFFTSHGSVTNSAYNRSDQILILFKDGSVKDIASASDLPNISVMSKVVRKYFLYWTSKH